MKNILRYSKKIFVFSVVSFFLFGPASTNSIELISSFPMPDGSIVGQLGQLLDDQHRRELDKEYREKPYGRDRWDDDWRRDSGEHPGEHRGWNRGKHKGWYKGKHKGWHKHHKHHQHHKHHGNKGWHKEGKHKGNDWKGGEWGGHKGSGKWGK